MAVHVNIFWNVILLLVFLIPPAVRESYLAWCIFIVWISFKLGNNLSVCKTYLRVAFILFSVLCSILHLCFIIIFCAIQWMCHILQRFLSFTLYLYLLDISMSFLSFFSSSLTICLFIYILFGSIFYDSIRKESSE